MTELREPPLVDNPYTTEYKYQCSMDAGMPQNLVVNDDGYVGFEEGKKAQRKSDIKWMKEHCYLKAERELPENPYEPPLDKTQEIWWDIVEARTKQMLKEVDGVAYRACEEFDV